MSIRFDGFDKTWIVAEIGVNHEGDVSVAEDLIHKAAEAGADAVKFQTYEGEAYVSNEQPERLARVKRYELSRDDFQRLSHVARDAGIMFFSTPLGLNDVDFLNGFAPLFKVASGEITWLDLIRRIAETGKPIIVSTGLATVDEIRAAVDTVLSVRPSAAEDGSFMLMHCVSCYPTEPSDANIRNMAWLHDTFSLPVGYSDHTLGIKACELAVAAGAVAVEKHFTYRKEDQAFHDHSLSADPVDLAALVKAIRAAETYLGRYERKRSEAEQKVEAHMRRSLAAKVDIAAGKPILAEWLTALRPMWGMGPNAAPEVIGKSLNRDRKAGELIRAEDIAN
jgi:N,N'-diacetyllegionaminate synthase